MIVKWQFIIWYVSKCKGPQSCTSLQVATNGRMMDLRFISITLEQYIREDIGRSIKDLRSMLQAKHEHEVTMYKV